jgi:hypothetical protein
MMVMISDQMVIEEGGHLVLVRHHRNVELLLALL